MRLAAVVCVLAACSGSGSRDADATNDAAATDAAVVLDDSGSSGGPAVDAAPDTLPSVDAAPESDAAVTCGTFGAMDASAAPHTVTPQATDPAISATWNAPHYAYAPARAAPRCKLVLFLVGLGGEPSSAQTYMAHVAGQGFHAIGLTYPNTVSPAPTCQYDADADCHLKLRQEELEGTDQSPLLVVSRADSIENRLVKLLLWLDGHFAGEGWSAYLADASTPRWSLTIATGHSHGSSTAAVIGKLRKVARVVILAGPYDFRAPDPKATTGTPAPWLTMPSKTDPSDFYAFVHLADAQSPQDFTNWDAALIPTVGKRVSVDGAAAPYGGSHQLTSNLAGGGHGTVLTNTTYAPVWSYLLE